MNGTYYILSTGRRTQESPYEMFVLESTIPDDPMGPYEFRGFLDLQGAIDGSAFEWEGQMYLLWSQLESTPGSEGLQQCNWIAALGSDWSLTERSRLSCADHAWEMVGNRVNEGPQAVDRDGRLFVVYSASLTLSTEYCLGLLEFKGGEVLDAANWFKHVQPVFQSDPQQGVYGPGHHTIARNPLTDEWILIYHAKCTAEWTADDRLVQAKTFSWDREGRPVFGRPSPYERSRAWSWSRVQEMIRAVTSSPRATSQSTIPLATT
ncbi:hypothetical protein H632_c531p0 [Helicosporidium sp. ATCC 50920]|nr:hypothetical protein H632_c531p0 [Helicosporidium sp. ATCC 50920]|eukprot:KDD75720.1 hypothetical protein H632_c531p0 [Helicosporidium sp. ATCC 50920]